MVWLPDVEKKIEDMFIRFDTIYERDRRTDGQTPHDGIASRDKNQYICAPCHLFTIFFCSLSTKITKINWGF